MLHRVIGASMLAASLVLSAGQVALAQPGPDRASDPEQVSPVRGIDRGPRRNDAGPPPPPPPSDRVRSIDGSDNNPFVPELGAAHTTLRRVMAPAYADGVSALAGADRPGARAVSNALAAQEEPVPNPLGASDFLWQWGQFLDHDMDLTDGVDPAEPANVPVPLGDLFFDPHGSGAAVIPLNRSLYDPFTGTSVGNPRQQINEISAWIDASNVYGSDAERAAALRTLDGTGRLHTSEGDLLPFNTEGLPNAGGPSPGLFLAGDVRANEQAGLAALHTLFVREHNRLAGEIARAEPRLSGEEIYQQARRIVGGEMQVITYREYLPALLGRGSLSPYEGYDPGRDAGISNAFSGASYRYGHSALSQTLLRLGPDGEEIAEGHLSLRDAFFNPARLTGEGGIAPLLRGLAAQPCQGVDLFVVDDVRNFLFGEPGQGGFDLAALNIQRGRDHGLPGYNAARAGMGLRPARSFGDVSSDPRVRSQLASVYGSVDAIDLWVGGLAEDPLPGSHVGELIQEVLVEQFEALRDGDRFWYEFALTPEERRQVERTSLADIIRRNTQIAGELQDDVFHVGRTRLPREGSDSTRPPRDSLALTADNDGRRNR